MASIERSCSPSFPARRCVVDSSILVRFFKCGRLEALRTRIRLVVAGQVRGEFRKDPGQRRAFDELEVEVVGIRPGSPHWDTFSRLYGANATTRGLGELESMAVALTARDCGEALPFLCCDRSALRASDAEGLLTLDFLDTLSWLVGCNVITAADADSIEQRARIADGWRPPRDFGGVEAGRLARQLRVVSPENP